MSNINDRGVIDFTVVEDDKYVLIIIDTLEWTYDTRHKHVKALQDKINDYLNYITSGQASQAKPKLRPVIRIIAQYSYSKYCIDYLERVKGFIKNKDDICDIEWIHDENQEGFNDGFIDDYVFEPDKIYPRLKKNWAKKPLEDISLMAVSEKVPDYNNLVMFRVMDSFIGTFVADIGDVFTYITYDMLPSNITPEKLQEIAFDNLSKNIEYRWCKSKEPGIFGIIAGGNFEAESICWLGLWEEIAEKLNDDIIIGIPTKDIVYYTKLNDDRLKNKMLKMSKEMFERNEKESPELIFCKDIFIYSRDNKNIFVSSDYSL